MPEQLTKHPDVTLQVLKSAGARCGEGAAQSILKACPADRFCALPGGEICVYGLPEATTMTQIPPAELAAAAGPPPGSPVLFEATSAAIGVLIGVLLAAALARLRQGQA